MYSLLKCGIQVQSAYHVPIQLCGKSASLKAKRVFFKSLKVTAEKDLTKKS